VTLLQDDSYGHRVATGMLRDLFLDLGPTEAGTYRSNMSDRAQVTAMGFSLLRKMRL